MDCRFIVVCLASVAFAACAEKEVDIFKPVVHERVFHASIERSPTRVYVNDELNLRWNADDRLSVFDKTTASAQYRFDGQDGDSTGTFTIVSDVPSATGSPLSHVYAVFPYNESTTISTSGELMLDLPSVQTYREGSFGSGANTMVAVADDTDLMFKNLCGYLMLKLYGEDVTVSSITLKGNDNEPLAGKAVVTASVDNLPSLSFDDTATKEIALTFDTPVTLGTTAETATCFWLVVPPTTFEGGFTVKVGTNDGKRFEKSTSKSLTVTRSTLSKMAPLEVVPEFHVNKYLTFTSEGATTVSVSNNSSSSVYTPVLFYSIDKINWTRWDNSELVFTSDQPLYICGYNPDGFARNRRAKHFVTSGSNFGVSGDVMALIDPEKDVVEIPSIYCFCRLFSGCTGLTSAPELTATTLKTRCYERMFYGCTNLTSAPAILATSLAEYCCCYMFSGCTSLEFVPDLPATDLADYCYNYMFDGCTGLVTAPALPATTLAEGCYQYMFDGCTGLVTTPALPATTLAVECYEYMFSGCTSLKKAPELTATILANSCYRAMFYCCTSLTEAPVLPATTMESSCYSGMFYGCTGLTDAPVLPATTLAPNCYGGMFNGCTSLQTAPDLPAASLAVNCYVSMFYNCSSLVAAPELPVTTLEGSCYSQMFYGCTSLMTAPDLPATTLVDYCYRRMFYGCTSLMTAPDLPATSLARECYSGMFSGCTSLTTAPDLPATSLAQECYSGMFSGCSALNYVNCLATDISASKCVTDWLDGVASTGTFIKASDMKEWQTGSSGIPLGWTVQIHGGIANYMTFNSEGTTTVALTNFEGNAPSLFYSYDLTNWTAWNYSALTFTSEQPLYLCGYNPEGISSCPEDTPIYSTFTTSGSNFGISGDIMSLIDYDNHVTTIPSKYCFYRLFYQCAELVTAPELPATNLTRNCYFSMFARCYNLTEAPRLPATKLENNCYWYMFSNCTSLTAAPELPATTLANSCYDYMFNNCTSLMTAPVLPATKLVKRCYYHMFNGCSSLSYVKCLATSVNATECLTNWLNGVADTGTFVKAAAMNAWPSGVSGIPEGWTAVNAE